MTGHDPWESSEEQIAQHRLDFIRLKDAATELRELHRRAEAIAPIIERWIDTTWGDIINAEAQRHVSHKATFLPHYLLDLAWGVEREIEHEESYGIKHEQCRESGS